jgi:hypothetical protein
LGRRDRGRAIAAAKIEDLLPLGDADPLDQGVAAFTHRLRNAREVALFPEGPVGIRDRIHRFTH